MAYYPKNKIQQNLQTNGNEYKTVKNFNRGGILYSGFYYKLFNGKTYTGRYPGDGNNEEIIPVNPTTQPVTPNPNSLVTTDIPPMFPTPKDYELGVFTRYFRKKRNEYLFDELTKDQYNTVNTTLYIKFSIQWQLVGDVNTIYNTNRNMVLLAEQREKALGLGLYLKEDYLKYYKAPTQDNLYTSGKEFKTPNGGEYIGSYHIHPDKGPMVGATHSIDSHSILIPINSTFQSSTGSQMMSNNIQPTTLPNYSSGGGSSGGSSY